MTSEPKPTFAQKAKQIAAGIVLIPVAAVWIGGMLLSSALNKGLEKLGGDE